MPVNCFILLQKQPEEEITVESLKKMMNEPMENSKQAEEERRLQIVEHFRNSTFEELVAKSEAKVSKNNIH